MIFVPIQQVVLNAVKQYREGIQDQGKCNGTSHGVCGSRLQDLRFSEFRSDSDSGHGLPWERPRLP